MSIDETLETIDRIIEPRQLNKIQRLVFQYAWQGLSYSEIARETDYDLGYIKDTGSKLWQLLSDCLGEKVTKQNLQAVLKQYVRQKPLSSDQRPAIGQDWGEAVDTSIFYGRSHELTTLSQWIIQERCRLIAILGMGGVGKTSLSVRLAEQVQGEFEYLFWRSLRDAPPFKKLLTSLLRFLSKEDSLPETENDRLTRLQECLQTTRCLIVLDNFDTLLKPGQAVGAYREGYEGYGESPVRFNP